MKRCGLLLIFLTLLPALASAWWNEEWEYKKKISLDMQKLQKDGLTVPGDAFALIRLHTGNFTYFLDLAEHGKDIRILAADEATPLKFYIEKLDPVNEMALIWVKLPKDIAASPEPAIWMYYGNAEAVDGQDAPGSYDVSQVLSYPFSKEGVKDLTANANNPSEVTTANAEGGLIAEAAVFQGSQIIRIPTAPSLQMSPATGWTFSTWLKIDQAQKNSVLFQRAGTAGMVALVLKEQTPYLEVTDASGVRQEFAAEATITPGAWHNLALVVTAANAVLYIDGVPTGTYSVALPELTGDIVIGADTAGTRGFSGAIDQMTLFKIARDANAVKFDVQMQGPASSILTYGEDATPDSEEGGESSIVATLKDVTVDAWVIIGMCGILFVISWMVMITKVIVIGRNHKENQKFEKEFAKLSTAEISKLDREDTEDDADIEASPLLLSLTGGHERFAGSSIYKLYHTGVHEINLRLFKSAGAGAVVEQAISDKGLNSVKAAMESVVTREIQKLNSQMVLLTIAISGGPFLGLLGTVLGVMMTFADIAASGEVNINAIAPGIAAALTATVAGLLVAIPALFGYSYIGSRIKLVTADMFMFVDEFMAKLSERYS